MRGKCFCISGKIIATNLFGKRFSKKFIKKRDLKKYGLYLHPAVAVDGIIEQDDKILLIKRKNPPFKGYFAIPGGFVECGETVENAVIREIKEETGLITEIIDLLGVYSSPTRDPRGHVISITYILKVVGGKLKAGDDAKEAEFFDLNALPELAFDHERIIKDYLRWKDGKVLSKM
ncbi:NUDIX hydrolase [Methanocaldococcus vulcanius M7]|uniref:NUDIX hydrolase n=1 Tax=Methanocaldococcus vulcanius (strain ATCC 700851 / DSM 12094 / M7) TaxID=579137 RepID=C9RF98_METVM|nr:NUDIX hydrolase [Methanocaldococcus vulcanius]ACX72250.1 NUDIX hydrolase [Methanocaldococcus vulcanius M7]